VTLGWRPRDLRTRLIVAACCASRLVQATPSAPSVSAQIADGTWLASGRDHVAISREMPALGAGGIDDEAVSLVFAGSDEKPSHVRVTTRRSTGLLLDTLLEPVLTRAPCPAGISGQCWATPPLRLTPDELDREYAPVRDRSLEAELGGELQVQTGAGLLGRWRVGAPHAPAFLGIDRLSVKLRVRILRVAPGGAPAIGGDAGSALLAARRAVQAASQLWSQCGIDLQGPSALDVQVVDPPPTSLIAVGCESGLPASGGELTLRVQGRRVRLSTRRGESPRAVAARLAGALERLGFRAQLSPNPRNGSDAAGVVDVLARAPGGGLLTVAADDDPRRPLSTDSTLGVCLGEVELGNGLSHFVESNARAGTLEERALIKAFDDGDPSTIEVFIVPSFDQSGRIGESFIVDAGAAIQNTVLIDRAALRAGPRSSALAHELGHILLAMPGHPDDYGVDQSSSLMDSDASDASVFGPRRLSRSDCERALLESGPSAPLPLLLRWPLAPLPSPASAVNAGR